VSPRTAQRVSGGTADHLSFTGSSTQRVSVNLSNVTYGSAKVSILKYDPIGDASGTSMTSSLAFS
jgi:hypothetical protein